MGSAIGSVILIIGAFVMTSAARIVASSLGAYAGLLGIAHGYFELRQGCGAPDSLLIQAIGPPCTPEVAYHACMPALTFLPSFCAAGFASIGVGLLLVVWAAFGVRHKHGGAILVALSAILLLVGGGIIQFFVAIIAGLAALSIRRVPGWWHNHLSHGATSLLSLLWPSVLIAYFVWHIGQLLFGNRFAHVLVAHTFAFLSLDIGLLLLTPLTAIAADTYAGGHRIDH